MLRLSGLDYRLATLFVCQITSAVRASVRVVTASHYKILKMLLKMKIKLFYEVFLTRKFSFFFFKNFYEMCNNMSLILIR